MSVRTFVDSNVLIYAYDSQAEFKQAVAKNLLHDLWETRDGVLSVQVLQEFYVNVTRKIPVPLSKSIARQIVEDFVSWCVDTTSAEILAAFSIEDRYLVSFWDALILAVAAKSGAHRVVSEDLNPGQVIAGMQIENPFA